MKIIELGEIKDYATKEEMQGSFPKFWVKINGKDFLFKENYYVNNEQRRTDFGEVLYSKICKKIKAPCVEAHFASYIDENNQKVNGVLIKSFLNGEDEFAINYSDLISKMVSKQPLRYYYSAESLVKTIKEYSNLENYKLNTKALKSQIIKECIVDYFLGQSDRGLCNIEFIANPTELKISPIFDNGFCLGFGNGDSQNKRILQDIWLDPKFEFNEEIMFSIFDKSKLKTNEYDYSKEIAELTKKSRFLHHFVNKIINLDIKTEIRELEKDNGITISPIMFKTSEEIFNRRKNLYLNHMQKHFNIANLLEK